MRTGGWVYPPGMSPEPAAPPPPRGSQPEPGTGLGHGDPRERPRPGEPRPGEPQPGERYGPIAIARHVKEDGRALLLYTRPAEPSA